MGAAVVRALVVSVGIALAVALLNFSPAAADEDLLTVTQDSRASSVCERTLKVGERRSVTRRNIFSQGQVVIDAWTVPFRNTRWRAEHPTNPAMTQYFHSSAWLMPPRPRDISRSVALLVDQATANPDPGGLHNRQSLVASGWLEAAVTLRLTTVLCVHEMASASDRRRLLPVINALIHAAKDDRRYYGPPFAPPHNHGVMSDRVLLEAAEILGRPDLARFAETRLARQLSGLYDSCGLNHEQSNGYQHLHASLWHQVSKLQITSGFRSRVNNELNRIRKAADALTWPDGMSPPIGNGRTRQISNLDRVSGNLSLFCPSTGWFSWRNSRADVTQQVIARFGPATAFHGHDDKGSVIWWVGEGAQGRQILVDRGLSGKNSDSLRAYSESPKAHATLLWDGGSALQLSGHRVHRNNATVLTMKGSPGPAIGTWTRSVTMKPSRSTLVIRDKVAGPAGSRPATSNLPLDPAWRPTRVPGTFMASDGTKVVITCTSRGGSPVAVRWSRVNDFQFDKARKAVSATCTVPRSSEGITTTLTVQK
jgi:hypothetical protein